MNSKTQITAEEHKRQIKAYRDEIKAYQRYVNVLDRIFRAAFPLAVVQARHCSTAARSGDWRDG